MIVPFTDLCTCQIISVGRGENCGYDLTAHPSAAYIITPKQRNRGRHQVRKAKQSPVTHDLQMLTEKQLLDLVQVGKSALWQWTKNGTFPAPRSVGPRSTRWLYREVREWLDSRAKVAGGMPAQLAAGRDAA